MEPRESRWKAGADAYLKKPFDIETLLSSVRDVLP